MHRIVVALALIGIFCTVSPAYAYLDPGTGSIILQGILAGIAALVFTGKLWWHRLLVLLGIRSSLEKSQKGEEKKEEEERKTTDRN